MKLLLPRAARRRALRAHLARGGLIAYPTESCFGLGCDPKNPRAVARLLALKERPWSKGLIVIADDFRRVQKLAAPLTPPQRAKALAAWPGPHTWLLPASRRTPPWLRGRHTTLAVRVSAHPVAAGLCRALAMALVSTSANRAGQKALKTAAACRRAFGPEVLVVPGKTGTRRRPSTIQELLSGRVARPG